VRRFVLLECEPQNLQSFPHIFRGLSVLIESDGTVAKVLHCKAEQFGSLRLRFLCILVRTPQFFTFDTSVQGHSCVWWRLRHSDLFWTPKRLGRVAHVQKDRASVRQTVDPFCRREDEQAINDLTVTPLPPMQAGAGRGYTPWCHEITGAGSAPDLRTCPRRRSAIPAPSIPTPPTVTPEETRKRQTQQKATHLRREWSPQELKLAERFE